MQVLDDFGRAVAAVLDVRALENGQRVARPERREPAEFAEKFGRDFRKIQFVVYFDFRHRDGVLQTLRNTAHERFAEGFVVFGADGEAGRIFVAAEMHEIAFAGFDGIVYIKSPYRAGRSHERVTRPRFGKDDGGAVVGLGQTGGHDADDALAPMGLEYHGGRCLAQLLVRGDFRQRLVGGLMVERLAFGIEGIDFFADFIGLRRVFAQQQFDGFLTVGDAAGGIDTRADKEDEVAVGQFFVEIEARTALRHHVRVFEQCFNARRRFCIDLLEAVVGKDAVLARNGYDVGGDADGHEVEQRIDAFGHNGLPFVRVGKLFLHAGLDELETHTATRQFGVGVTAVDAFGVEHRVGFRQGFAGAVVIAYDDVDAFFFGITHFFMVLDAAVQHDEQFGTALVYVVDAAPAEAVAVFVAVGNEKIHIGAAKGQERIHDRHGCGAVHVVVTVNENLFLMVDGLPNAVHGQVHVFHQERVVQVGHIGLKEFAHLFGCRQAPLIK